MTTTHIIMEVLMVGLGFRVQGLGCEYNLILSVTICHCETRRGQGLRAYRFSVKILQRGHAESVVLAVA